MILLAGYGFLGKSLAAYFSQQGISFSVADRNINNLPEKDHRYFDLENISTYSEALQDIDTIIHLIHPTVPANSVFSAEIDLEYYIEANRKFIDYVSTTGIKKIIYISTGGAIYGNADYQPTDELHPCRPISNYGMGKLLTEQLLLKKCNEHNIDLKILRPSNIYGKFQKTDKPQGIIAHILEALLQNTPLTIWGNGTQKKDYLYINDFTRAVEAIISAPETTETIYNISSGQSFSLLEIIEKLEDILQNRVSVNFTPEKEFDIKTVLLSNERFKKDFNWELKYSLDEGLRDMLQLKLLP